MHQQPTVSSQVLFPADSLAETDWTIGLAIESGIRESCSFVTVTGCRHRSRQVKSRDRDLYGLRFASERSQYPRGPVPRRQSKGARLVLRNRISRKNRHSCDKFAGFNVISRKSSRPTEGGMVKNRATGIAQRTASGARLTRFYPSSRKIFSIFRPFANSSTSLSMYRTCCVKGFSISSTRYPQMRPVIRWALG